MTELDKLIEEFKITLDKFEAIASRMEERMATSEPVDPLATLPPFPPVPEGYSRWVYRGKGWTSMDFVKYAYWMYPFKVWVTLNDSIPVGIKDNHYIEAVKDPA